VLPGGAYGRLAEHRVDSGDARPARLFGRRVLRALRKAEIKVFGVTYIVGPSP